MRLRLLLPVVSIVFVVGGCATVDPREDTRIEAEVKAQLVGEKDANLTRLNVVSSNGTVYLTGTVQSSEELARAEALARSVRGVRRVMNTLKIQPSPE